MDVRTMMVVGVWAFAIIFLVGMLVLQADLFISLVVFLIAIVVSFAAIPQSRESAPPSKSA